MMKKLLGGAALSVLAVPAMAAPVDYSSLTTAVDFSSSITAIITVFAALALVYVAMKGAKFVIAALR